MSPRAHFAANPVSSVRVLPSSPLTDEESPFPPTPPQVDYYVPSASSSSSSPSYSTSSSSPSSYSARRPRQPPSPAPSEYSPPRSTYLSPPSTSSPNQHLFPAQPLVYTPSPTLSTLSFSPNGQAHIPSPKTSALQLHPALMSLTAHTVLPQHVLSEPATHPPLPHLVIRSELLPWQATADARRRPYVTVGEVHAAFTELLRARASESEFRSERKDRQKTVRAAFYARTAADQRARDQGLRRVDFLEGREVLGLRAGEGPAGVCEVVLGRAAP